MIPVLKCELNTLVTVGGAGALHWVRTSESAPSTRPNGRVCPGLAARATPQGGPLPQGERELTNITKSPKGGKSCYKELKVKFPRKLESLQEQHCFLLESRALVCTRMCACVLGGDPVIQAAASAQSGALTGFGGTGEVCSPS